MLIKHPLMAGTTALKVSATLEAPLGFSSLVLIFFSVGLLRSEPPSNEKMFLKQKKLPDVFFPTQSLQCQWLNLL